MANLTPDGLEKLKKELEYLKTTKRKEIAERLKQAIAFGDLTENAAYHEAKESQGFLEGRILELTKIIREARIIQKSTTGRVALGSKVLLEIDGEKQEFEIVGPSEANPSQGKISDVSPLGAEILNKERGQSGELKTPEGKLKYKILEIN
jgi:transcription elongation factor GreA